jgi:predicted porin
MSRKSLIKFAPLALSALVGTAFADDTNVTLYGILDASVANIQHSYNFDANAVSEANPLVVHATQSATGMFSGGLSPSRWGIKGTEDMGGGVKAIFLLESAINIGSGTLSNGGLSLTHSGAEGPNVSADSAINGQLFSRGAYVGLSSTDYGQITLGRNTTFFLDNIGQTDPLLGSYAFSPIGYSGAYGGGGYTDDSRVDNSLKYKISFGDFGLGLLYKFGGVSGSTSAQGAYQANLSYVSGPLGVYFGYQQFKDAFSLGGGTTGVLSATAADTKAFMLSAKYSFDATKTTIRGGYEREQFQNPSNPGTAAAGTTPATGDQAINSLFGYTIGSVGVESFYSEKKINVFWIGGTQEITNAFSVSAGWYRASQNSWSAGATGSEYCGDASGKHNTLCSGATNYYSLVLDYRFSKRTDTYAGIMKDTASGGMAAGFTDPGNRIIAVGLRHSF